MVGHIVAALRLPNTAEGLRRARQCRGVNDLQHPFHVTGPPHGQVPIIALVLGPTSLETAARHSVRPEEPHMSATEDARVVRPGAGRVFSTGRSNVRVKIESAVARSFAAFEATPLPGVPGPPQHVHRAYDEAWYVLEGEMTFHLGADAHQCVAGSVVFAPRGTPHTFSNTGLSPARVLVIITAQALPLIEELGRLTNAGGPPDMEALQSLLDEHQTYNA
jgi:mannose-6-phosphate isomerase-like protein (cupin superfamily)